MLCECKNLYKLGISAIKNLILLEARASQSEEKGEKRRKKNEKERSLLKKNITTPKPDMFMNEFMTQKSD